MIRAPFIGELPADTRWYEVDNLTDEDRPELHVVARCGWDDPSGQDKNELFKVAARRKSDYCGSYLKAGSQLSYGGMENEDHSQL
jgi:hypothetical protein